jgi:hypothetical protein
LPTDGRVKSLAATRVNGHYEFAPKAMTGGCVENIPDHRD